MSLFLLLGKKVETIAEIEHHDTLILTATIGEKAIIPSDITVKLVRISDGLPDYLGACHGNVENPALVAILKTQDALVCPTIPNAERPVIASRHNRILIK